MSKLVKNTMLYTIGNFLPRGVSVIIVPIYSIYLTTEDYGILSMAGVVHGFIFVFMTFALERAIPRLYYNYTVEERKDFISTISSFIVINALIILTILFIFNNVIESLFSNIPFFPILSIALITSFVTVFTVVPLVYYRLNDKPIKFLLLSLIPFVVSTFLKLWFLISLNKGVIGVLYAGLFGKITAALLSILVLINICRFSFKKKFIIDAVKFSGPMIPTLILGWVLGLSDRIFIDRYIGLSELGVFSMAASIAMIFRMFNNSFNLSYDPYYYKVVSTFSNIEAAKRKLYLINNSYILIFVIVVSVFCLFSRELIYLLLDKRYHETSLILPISILSISIILISTVLNKSIYQSKKTQYLLYITIIAAIVKTGFNFLLIPTYGMYGAVWGSVFTHIIYFAVLVYYAKKCYYIGFDLKLLLPVIIIGLITNVLNYFFPINNLVYSLFIKTLFILIVFLVYYKRLMGLYGIIKVRG